MFESHAGCLNHSLFVKFALPYIRQISQQVRDKLRERNIPSVPMIIFAKDGHFVLDELAHSNYEVIGLDWTIEPEHARRICGQNISFQGNLDPCALYANKNDLTTMARDMLQKFGHRNYIANLGHGIYPDIDPENVRHLVDQIHEISKEMMIQKN